MNATTEEKQYRLDSLKWSIVVSLTAGAIYGNHYFSEESLLYRAVAWIFIAVCVAFIGLIFDNLIRTWVDQRKKHLGID